MYRRDFISAAVGLALTNMLFLSGCDQSESLPAPEIVIEEGFTGYLRSLQGTAVVGAKCIEVTGYDVRQKDGFDSQFTALFETDVTTVADYPGFFAQRIQQDFAEDKIYEVDNWVLSHTECLLNAMALQAGASQDIEQTEIINESFVEVRNWGPQNTYVNVVFNQQADGHAGIWIQADNAPASTVLYFAGHKQATTVYGQSVTSGIHGDFMKEILSKPGMHEVALVDMAAGKKQVLGFFNVEDRGEMAVLSDGKASQQFCKINRWGPNEAISGQPFNEQPDGASAFWIRVNCAPKTTVMYLEDEPLKTTVRAGVITSHIPNGHTYAAGTYGVSLRDSASGEVLEVGRLVIH